jgi:3-phenylpropionate/trans-cinnamate dioxygenase ferredoxin subunit
MVALARVRVAGSSDVAPGDISRVEVDGLAVCLAHVVGEGIFAVADRCTHEDIELSGGDLEGAEIECPAHGSRFDVRTGAVRGLPASVPADTYRVEVEGDDVFVVI